ncbi:10981_t:CDS:2 [Cetraspora pellucida]|uniref:10981_t:CDS:1 n=1 Tax=Cetraspora pellucida TaxID=1433469 RepID=A0ACA9LWN4_9GLOM|nr:10981_t:CDS:2 [Cetraspora pellucida]
MTTVRAVYVDPALEGSPKEFSYTVPSFNSNQGKEAMKSLTETLLLLQKDINNHLTLQLKATVSNSVQHRNFVDKSSSVKDTEKKSQIRHPQHLPRCDIILEVSL